MKFGILGPLEASTGGVDVTPTAAKQRALLALLVLHPGELMAAERLVEEVWSTDAPDSARNALQVHLSQLRRRLGPAGALIQTRPGGYLLDVDGEQVDAVRFERLLARGRRALELGAAERAARSLGEALDLWRGEALSDLRYEPFAQAEAARLEELRLAALESRVEADLALGHHADCVSELEALISREPMREHLHELLMLALYRSGRQADALGAFRGARETLVKEIGIEPGPALRELERRMLAQDPELDLPGLPSVAAPEALPGFAASATTFVGREQEIAELSELVHRRRLVTISGPGGAGKTRLALRVAELVAREFEHGAHLVELASVRTPVDVWPAVSAALELPEGGTSYAEGVLAQLSERHALLVLDNCEHVLGGAREVAETLMAGCSKLTVLATTREALGIRTEALWPIPDMGEDAVVLFAERAERALGGHTLEADGQAAAARICERLDRLPLAIELAAARLSVLSVAQIDERLSERFRLLTRSAWPAPDRHRTLRAAVDWSYDLLAEPERVALAAMSVFQGGFDIDAAEVVVAVGGVGELDVLDLLAQLVEKSLVARREEQSPHARYGLHETIREYAQERLADLGLAAEVRQRHAEHFLALAERAEPHLDDLSSEWLDRLEREHDNLRAALSHFERTTGNAQLMRLVGALAGFWEYSGHLREGAQRLASALARDARPTAARAKALTAGSAVVAQAGDPAAAEQWAREGLALHRGCDDALGIAEALRAIGYAVAERGNPGAAQPFLIESLTRLRELGDEHRALFVARSLAWTDQELGNLDRARALHEENLERARSSGHERMEARSLGSLANVAVDDHRAADAIPLLERAYEIDRRLGDRLEVSLDLCRLAKALAALGDAHAAARLLGSFESIAQTSGTAVPWVTRMNAATLESVRDQIGVLVAAAELDAGRLLSPDHAVALAGEVA